MNSNGSVKAAAGQTRNMLKHFGLKQLHKDDSSPHVSLNYVAGQRFN